MASLLLLVLVLVNDKTDHFNIFASDKLFIKVRKTLQQFYQLNFSRVQLVKAFMEFGIKFNVYIKYSQKKNLKRDQKNCAA